MKISVTAAEIATLLDQAPPTISVLSLDCFDTLLWRNAQAPSDIFAELGLEGGSIDLRVGAERQARRAEALRHGRNEVSIETIHGCLLAGASDAELSASVRRELDAEARHCFGFAPVVALIQAAKARGIKIAIVSDTYFSAEQLGELIARAAGDEVAAAIDHVFTSSDHGLSKGEGLFGPVLTALGVTPAQLLHLGDNPVADQDAPAAMGIATAHFVQFADGVAERLRHEAMAAVMIEPATRQALPAVQPHRPLLSLRAERDAAFALGHDVVGPLLHSFSEWVRDEAAALAAAHGKPPKILFVMRDGYLPMRMFETLGTGIATGEISVSRLTAARASMIDEAAVRRLVERQAGRHRLDVLAGMLLLEPHEARKLIGAAGDTPELEKAACEDEAAGRIARRSARHADRLIAHLKRQGLQDGDVAMLVDLGYHGTVQDNVAPLLAKRMNVAVAGRYLLLREKEATGFDKKGYFDKRHYGRETLAAMGSSIGVVEQICTQAKGSVVDYRPDGKPVHEKADQKGGQSETRERIQAGAVAFGEAATAAGRHAASDDDDARRRAAAAMLARLMYMPSAEEAALIADFTHDANLGTDSYLKLLDAERAMRGLRRRGMHYVQSTARIFLPAELQGQGLAMNLALFGIVGSGLDVRESDFQAGGVPVPVVLANAQDDCLVEVDAFPTHDGYYRLTVPARGDLTVAVLIGGLYEAVQIEDVSFQPIEDPRDEPGLSDQADIEAPYVQEGMEPIAGDLFRCTDNAALLVPAQAMVGEGGYKLCIVFRPVVRRSEAAEMRKVA